MMQSNASNMDAKAAVDDLVEKTENGYTCKACGKTMKTLDIRRHAEIHIEGLSYDCQLCDKTFRSRMALANHRQDIHRNKAGRKRQRMEWIDSKDFRQELLRCLQGLDSQINTLLLEITGLAEVKEELKQTIGRLIQDHINLTIDIAAEKYEKQRDLPPANILGKSLKHDNLDEDINDETSSFTKPGGLTTNLQSMQKVVSYACNQCDYQATQQGNLTTHVKSKHQKIRYFCGECDKESTTKSNLRNHIRSLHEGLKYACNQCDYQATTTSNLAKHIQYKHDGVKFACNQCDKIFTQPINLKIHIQYKHEGVKYTCNHCDKLFTKQNNLKTHVKNKHLGVKYACNQCDKLFSKQSNLKTHFQSRHERKPTNTKEGKYSCDSCDFKTMHNRSLKRHTETLHAEKNERNS